MKMLSTTWKHIRRSPYQALAAIFIMTQTFFVITLFTFLIFGSAKIIDYFESQPRLNAFFNLETKQEDIDTLGKELKKTDLVANLTFVSKKEAVERYKKWNADDPLMTEFVSEGVLPASYEITAKNLSDLEPISEILKKSPLVLKVQFPKDVVENLLHWTDAIRKIGIVVISVLALDSIFLMVIIIGIKISQKKEEIEIMQLLSATKWYIRWPFLYEGILYGMLGALIGWSLAIGILMYYMPTLKSFFADIPVLSVSPLFVLQILGIEAVIALIIGILSSYLAVLRYQK